jgi:hypothetical protein
MTVEFDVDVRGEMTEKKFLKIMRNGTSCKNPNFVDISVDGVPNEILRQLADKKLKEDLSEE